MSLPADIMTEDTLLRAIPAIKTRSPLSLDREQALLDRFKRIQSRQAKRDVVYEFTRDPGYLQQYYYVREQMFISVWGLKHFQAQEDGFDKNSEILILRDGNHVIGGARITVQSEATVPYLPMEGDDFDLKSLFPILANKKYGEVSRVALLEDYRKENYLVNMYRHIVEKCIALGLDYSFAIAPILQARNTRKIMHSFEDLCAYTMRKDVKVPEREEYEGIKMSFAVFEKPEFIGSLKVCGGDF